MANLTTKSKYNLINYFKEEGNSNFKQKKYHQSLQYYQNCLSFLDCLYFDQITNSSQHDDDNKDEGDTDIPKITSTVLSNIAQAHLHIHASDPDLYSHLMSSLNCSQISLKLNPSNTKSIVRRIITLYRLGLYEFAQSIFNQTVQDKINIKASVPLIEKEKKKVENNSVKYHVDRFIHEILNNDGAFKDKKEEVDIEKNVFLRIAGAELIRQNKYKLEDFMAKYFSKTIQSLQVITMIGIFLNWEYKKITSYFMKYLKIYLGEKSISFNKTKEIIKQCIKIDDQIWITDQAWKIIVKQLIIDRHEIEWCDILNVTDHGVLNKIYDKYKHKLVNNKGIKFKKTKSNNNDNVTNENYKYVQTEINELKRLHQVDKQHIFKLVKRVEKLEKNVDNLQEKINVLEKNDSSQVLKKQMDEMNNKIFYVQVVFGIIIVLLAIFLALF